MGCPHDCAASRPARPTGCVSPVASARVEAVGRCSLRSDCAPGQRHPPIAARWYSSTEPKAIETARFCTDHEISIVEDLREQVRPVGWLDSERDWRLVVRAAFEHPLSPVLPGWEPLDRTRRRVKSAVLSLVMDAGRSQVVASGHGTAWTALVSEVTGCPPDLDAWEQMLMPAHCALDLDTGGVVSRWGSWA
jgi:broad specificity phosphatase PhoE